MMSWNRHSCPHYSELQCMFLFSTNAMSRTSKWSLSSRLCDREVTHVSLHPRESPSNLYRRPLKQHTSRHSWTKRRIFRVPAASWWYSDLSCSCTGRKTFEQASKKWIRQGICFVLESLHFPWSSCQIQNLLRWYQNNKRNYFFINFTTRSWTQALHHRL